MDISNGNINNRFITRKRVGIRKMVLGEKNKCWMCWEQEAYKNKNFDLKQFCTPIRAKKETLLSGSIVWLCNGCRKKVT